MAAAVGLLARFAHLAEVVGTGIEIGLLEGNWRIEAPDYKAPAVVVGIVEVVVAELVFELDSNMSGVEL
jgi:hypothetical protein